MTGFLFQLSGNGQIILRGRVFSRACRASADHAKTDPLSSLKIEKRIAFFSSLRTNCRKQALASRFFPHRTTSRPR